MTIRKAILYTILWLAIIIIAVILDDIFLIPKHNIVWILVIIIGFGRILINEI
jgi:hypothetical protein